MPKTDADRGLKKGVGRTEEITDDDRAFMRRMEKRMPKLSLRNKMERASKEGHVRLEGGYLRKFYGNKGRS